MVNFMKPCREYEAHLREVYAQDRQNPTLEDPYFNVIPFFTDDTTENTTRARDLSVKSEEVVSRYIMPLPEDKRRAHGSPTIVSDFSEFQNNFKMFSESSLVEVDWTNLIAADSSFVNCSLENKSTSHLEH
ncbi:hypothetical protein EsDP_00002053 [Epichloe bromicola]|uniref:Uncharacterized protein n=1 Tax=Epichloe bromicola TaxID=79588 RepID=A0ABQ0CJN3_9HYPO